MNDLVVLVTVIAGLLAIFMIVIGLARVAVRLFVVVVVVTIGWSLLRGTMPSIRPPGGSPQVSFQVVASRDGGWDVTIPPTADATEYRVSLDGDRVAKQAQPGIVHVGDHAVGKEQYLPDPVRTFTLRTITPQGTQKQTTQWCSPVVYLSARGTWEDKGEASFGHGIGSRGWRTWMKLAKQLGIAPSKANVLPTIVGASPVKYPATVFSKQTSGYADSRNAGVADLIEQIQSVSTKCPDSMMILFGYSQGADVVDTVWQKDTTDPLPFLGVVAFADPHFNKKWTEQLTVLPKGGKWTKNGLLGTRPKFDDSELDGLQEWCLPGDPVCQKNWLNFSWHGHEYDCFEDWAAYRLAEDVVPFLRQRGFQVSDRQEPSCTPATQKGKDPTLSYEPDPLETVA